MKSGNARRVSPVEESPRAFYRRAEGDSNRTAEVEGDAPLNIRANVGSLEAASRILGSVSVKAIAQLVLFEPDEQR